MKSLTAGSRKGKTMEQPVNRPAESPVLPPDTGQVPAPLPVSKKSVKLKILVGLVVIFVVVAGALIYYSTNLTSEKRPEPLKPVGYWNQIIPGQTKKDEIIQKLGNPKSEEEKNQDYSLLGFASDSPTTDHYVTIQKESNSVASAFYVVGKDEGKKLDQFLQEHGQPEKVMYSNFMDGVKTFIWLKVGLAVWADENSGGILFIRYFIPMELSEFINLYGGGLLETNPYIY